MRILAFFLYIEIVVLHTRTLVENDDELDEANGTKGNSRP